MKKVPEFLARPQLSNPPASKKSYMTTPRSSIGFNRGHRKFVEMDGPCENVCAEIRDEIQMIFSR